jgi:hypothetical protein
MLQEVSVRAPARDLQGLQCVLRPHQRFAPVVQEEREWISDPPVP